MTNPAPCRNIMVGLLAMLCCGTAHATITLSTTTRAGTSATGTGTAISGRAPLPVVIDAGSGTTTTHSTGSAEQIGIRFAEKKLTTCSYTHGTLTLTCTDAFTTFSWELNTASTNGATDWTASAGDLLAYYHDGGTEVHGKPIGVRINGVDATEGTIGSLSAGQWAWGDVDTIGSNRVYVQLTPAATDPDAEATGHVKVLYGDGEYIELQHADFNSGNPVYVYVDTKVSDDAITLMAAPTGASADETNVTVFQAVNPWTDLRYNYSVSCPNGGGNCIEDITNGDQRPGLTTTAIDETVGRGPIWAFVFKEGFGLNAEITITANDDANGDTQDSQTIDVDETSWSGSAIKYLSSAGNDSNTGDDATAGGAWLTWEKGLEWLDGATAPAELVLVAGETIDHAGTVLDGWSNISGDRRIRTTVTGTKATVTIGANERFVQMTGDSGADLRLIDLDINKTGATDGVAISGSGLLVLRCDMSTNTGSAVLWGTGTASSADAVFWDSIFTSSDEYAVYSSGDTSAEISRRVMVGNVLNHNGSATLATSRFYVINAGWMYNQFNENSTAATSSGLRINAGNGIPGDNEYVAFNHIRESGNTSSAHEGFLLKDDAVGTDYFNDVLLDGNFFESDEAATTTHIAVSLLQVTNLVVSNNVFHGWKRHINSGSSGSNVRVFNNSAYSALSTDIWFMTDAGAGTGSYSNLKAINNAMICNSSTSGRVFESNNGLGTIESTHFLENVIDFGTVTSAWGIEGSTGGFTGSGWPAQTGKAAQLNYTGNQGKDNDPLFALPASNDFRLCTGSGVPDASCSGASPCIDAGYDLPTVYYDYSGAVRNSDDIGAWDDDSNGAGPPAAGDGANDMMLMGVAR